MNEYTWNIAIGRDLQCEGITKAGNRCKARAIDRFHPTCHAHLTPDVKKMAELLAATYEAGCRAGEQAAEDAARMRWEHAERTAHRIAEEAFNYRTHTPAGRQVFQVQAGAGSRLLTYEWAGADALVVGDPVWLPSSWAVPAHAAVVTELGSAYVGELREVRRRATPSETTQIDEHPLLRQWSDVLPRPAHKV